jgi:hypothetical protein
MKKVLLLLFFFLLNSCSLNSILALGEVNKTQVVKRSYYVKHYRAYFTRSPLRTITRGKKYLYFYNAKKRDLAVLLHKRDQYILYSLFYPSQRAMVINTHQKNGYRYTLKHLKQRGYYRTSPTKTGCTSHVTQRKYKGIKTLLIEIKDYSRLQNIYKKAIKTYSAKKVKNIRTKLPKQLIASYYNNYDRRAKTRKQRKALHEIGMKLQLKSQKSSQPTPVKKSTPFTKKTTIKKEEVSQKKEIQEQKVIEKIEDEDLQDTQTVEILNVPVKKAEKSFDYYLYIASYNELNPYISTGKAKNDLSHDQYSQLIHRRIQLQEKNVLQNGSLEELIAAYKKNKNPQYKARILTLMKKAQEKK